MVVIQLGRQHSFAEFLINGVFYAKEEEFFSQATSRRPIFDWHLQFFNILYERLNIPSKTVHFSMLQ